MKFCHRTAHTISMTLSRYREKKFYFKSHSISNKASLAAPVDLLTHALDRGSPIANVVCQIQELAMSPVVILAMSMSIF